MRTVPGALRTRPRIEPLEDRCLLAGNVSAAFASGDLVLTGDSQGNAIDLIQTAANTIEVRGVGTTINGGTMAFPVTGVDDVRIGMGGGSDAVRLACVVPGELSIQMGDGDDGLFFGGFFEPPPGLIPLPFAVDVGDELSIATGDGHDFTGIFESRVAGETVIGTGGGDDTLLVVHTRFLDEAAIATGAGNDFVEISVSTFCEETELTAGAGDDTVLVIESSFADEVKLRGGTGVDTLLLSNNVFQDDLEVTGFES